MNTYSEAEARTKWCPFATARSVITNVGASGNRNLNEVEWMQCKCLASDCMVWRWAFDDPTKPPEQGGILLPRSQWPGYCGMAGRL